MKIWPSAARLAEWERGRNRLVGCAGFESCRHAILFLATGNDPQRIVRQRPLQREGVHCVGLEPLVHFLWPCQDDWQP